MTVVLLETQRLRLRSLDSGDVENLTALDSDPEVMRHLSHGIATPREEIAQEVLPEMMSFYEQPRPIGFWAVELRGSGEFIGWFHLRPDKISAPEMELGYRFVRRAWRQGYATEGAVALIALGFQQLSCDVITARTLMGNIASQRVMQRCGLSFEEYFSYPVEMLPTWSEEERRAVKYSVKRSKLAVRAD